MTANYNAQEVIATLKANGGEYIDDHRKSKSISVASFFGIYVDQGKEHAFIGYTDSLFCINKCYVEDGIVHLSTWSVGGNVRMDRFPNDPEGAIESFNKDCMNYNIFDKTAKISEWHIAKAA